MLVHQLHILMLVGILINTNTNSNENGSSNLSSVGASTVMISSVDIEIDSNNTHSNDADIINSFGTSTLSSVAEPMSSVYTHANVTAIQCNLFTINCCKYKPV